MYHIQVEGFKNLFNQINKYLGSVKKQFKKFYLIIKDLKMIISKSKTN